MSQNQINRRTLLVSAMAFGLAGCADTGWRVDYTPVTEAAANWRFAGVTVMVPQDLTVSESNDVFVPNADIVWQEEPLGDRRTQVRKIMEEGIAHGARGLRGRTPVRFVVVMQKFHSINKKSIYSAPPDSGVENIDYSITVVDARSGATLLPAQLIREEFPGLVGDKYFAALNAGQTERMRIVAHVSQTIAGWLGIGPDNRMDFMRAGG